MKIQKKIGWQKYEDLIEAQLDSPLLDMLIQKMSQSAEDEMDELSEEELEMLSAMQNRDNAMVHIDEKMMENITLATNFDCWMGHTNFNITKDIRDKLNKTEGIEILKICSRYRFFVGIGRMFDFTEVRKNIENLLNEE